MSIDLDHFYLMLSLVMLVAVVLSVCLNGGGRLGMSKFMEGNV